MMYNDDMERILKEAVMVYLRYYPDMFLERLKKSTKHLSK